MRAGTGLKLERGVSVSGLVPDRAIEDTGLSVCRPLCLVTSGEVFGLGFMASRTLWVFDFMASGEGLHLGLNVSGEGLDLDLATSGDELSFWGFRTSSASEAFLMQGMIEGYCCCTFSLSLSATAADSLTEATGRITSEWANSILLPKL